MTDPIIVTSHWMREHLKEQADAGGSWCAKPKIGQLQQLITGFYGGELTVITGPTKNGKTLFAQTLTKHFAEGEPPIQCLWFSYEVPPKQFLEQFGDSLPLFYLPYQLKGRDMGWLYDRIKRAVKDDGCKVVFVDHLHFLFDILTSGNPSLQIGGIMRQLKGIAIEQDIHLFLIAHMRKVGKDQDGTWREPEAGDTRDSSFIEQETDNMIAVWRGNQGNNRAKIKVIHNRRFGVMDAVIEMVKQGPYLVEYDAPANEPARKWTDG